MVIDFSDLKSMKVTKKDLNLTFTIDKIDDNGDVIKFSEPVNLEGTLTFSEGILTLNGLLKVTLILNCSRCLEKFKYPLQIPIEERFSTNEDLNDKDEDIIIVDVDKVDIDDIIIDDIMSSLPFKRLCKENCKGLCQHCGTNLNLSTCNCEKDDIDPRLAKLKDMFLSD